MTEILVLKPSSLGDIVHALPAVAHLRAGWPQARLTWLVNSEWAPLLAGHPALAAVLPFPRRRFRGVRGWARVWPWVHRHLRPLRPDLAVDYQGLLRSACLARLSRAGTVVGSADAREGASRLYHRAAPLPPAPAGRPLHAVERYLGLSADVLAHAAAARGGSGQTAGPTRTPLPPAGEGAVFDLPPGEAPHHLLARAGWSADRPPPFLVLHPLARGPGKTLPPPALLALCRRLAPWPVVVVGQGASPPLAGPGLGHCHDWVNATTLPELIWTLRRAAFTISVDSGPAHLAAALGDRLVSLHAWTDPRRVGPYRPGAWVWKAGRLARAGDLLAGATGPADSCHWSQPARLDRIGPQDLAALARLAQSGGKDF